MNKIFIISNMLQYQDNMYVHFGAFESRKA